MSKGVRVLIVEDDFLICELIKSQLEEIGFLAVGETANGLEAVELTQALQPDVVLMDVQLSGLNGIEAARRIRDSCPTPVVVLTGFESSDLIERASEAGVGAYIVKPPNMRKLERAITIAIARYEDMTELRRLNQHLQARNAELDTFADTVAHDLKAPLSLIIGFSELLRKYRTTLSQEELDECVEGIEQSGLKMSHTIEQLLVLAKARDMEAELAPLDMADIVGEAMERVSHTIQERRAEIILPESWPLALGNALWVEEIWVNYLSNAVKYGGDPPRVELGATRQTESTIRFWIRDNGPGISPEKQALLFTPFARPGKNTAKGHGLGLSIVRRIVKRLGGEVGVESKGGEGSTFSFTLPAVPDQEPDAE